MFKIRSAFFGSRVEKMLLRVESRIIHPRVESCSGNLQRAIFDKREWKPVVEKKCR